jgi:ABC-2 type transport system ATP-binding protein
MRKMGQKRLTLEVQNKLDALPPELASHRLTIAGEGHQLIYDYDTEAERTGIATLLGELSKAGIRIRDLHTKQSSLEEIFVGLVSERK